MSRFHMTRGLYLALLASNACGNANFGGANNAANGSSESTTSGELAPRNGTQTTTEDTAPANSTTTASTDSPDTNAATNTASSIDKVSNSKKEGGSECLAGTAVIIGPTTPKDANDVPTIANAAEVKGIQLIVNVNGITTRHVLLVKDFPKLEVVCMTVNGDNDKAYMETDLPSTGHMRVIQNGEGSTVEVKTRFPATGSFISNGGGASTIYTQTETSPPAAESKMQFSWNGDATTGKLDIASSLPISLILSGTPAVTATTHGAVTELVAGSKDSSLNLAIFGHDCPLKVGSGAVTCTKQP